ncbi:hypothetical protein BGAL_0458g00010 [Botrytis galanthina]|uniref:Uncharacterized protein n=1 Tax=Botrytis galanthina TaxID=278940 RepID=A0A4S8QM50_9HELO|nr:hypothetical protein BGAL_0458g00010 [Botrytis galanthina]
MSQASDSGLEHTSLAHMSQSSDSDLESVSFTPPPPPHTSGASESRSGIIDSSNVQTAIATVSNSSRELPREPTVPEFPLYDCLPREIRCEVMYQAALQIEPRLMPINIETRLRWPDTRLPSDRVDAFLQAGGKWKMQERDFQYLTITRGYGWHARDELILEEFHFRPEKDILWFSEDFVENYQNIKIYPSESVKRLMISIENFRELLTLYTGHIMLDAPKHSTLFIDQLQKLEHIYVVPSCDAGKERLSESFVLMEATDNDAPDPFDRRLLLICWSSWLEKLEKDSVNIGWTPPEISFKNIRWT